MKVFTRSPGGSRVRSPGKVFIASPTDFQTVVGYLQRAGLGKLVAINETATTPTIHGYGWITPSGPLLPMTFTGWAHPTPFYNTTIDPLYLQLVVTVTWDDGFTCTRTIVYDATYADMTQTDTYSWQSGSTQTNVAPTYNDFGFPQPSGPGTSGVYGTQASDYVATVLTTQSYINSVAAGDLTGVETWGALVSDGGTVYHGVTRTFTLTTVKTWADYRAICDALLNNVPLGDGLTGYSGWSTTLANLTTNFLKFFTLLTIASASVAGKRWMQTMAVHPSRSGGFKTSDFSIFNYYGISSLGPFITINAPVGPIKGGGYLDNATSLPIIMHRQPVCCSGVPVWPHNFAFSSYPFSQIPASQCNAAWIMSSKSSLNATVDMSASFTYYGWTASTNTWATVSGTTPNSALAVYRFDPTYLPAGSDGVYLMSKYASWA